jgi:DNA-binding NtrC family response regulator
MRRSVLVVDDDPQVRTLCRVALEGAGYSVREAVNGKEAVSAIEATAVDVVVLDLSMPDMDGFEFLNVIRVRAPKPKVIVMSGFLGGSMLPAAKLFGACATIAKPFSLESLLAAVADALAAAG